MDSIDAFAIQARLFERWLLEGTDQQADAATEGLKRLLELYRAALDLPAAWSDELREAADAEQLGEDEVRRAADAARRLPTDFYSEVFDPTITPPAEPVTGSLVDDLADIYRDVGGGLRAYERGDRAAAAWEWSFNLHSHWGAHATGAIRALHWWLVDQAALNK